MGRCGPDSNSTLVDSEGKVWPIGKIVPNKTPVIEIKESDAGKNDSKIKTI
jgi:hypothetical protein